MAEGIVSQRQALLKALPQVHITALTNHQCSHCHQIVIDSKTAFWIQHLPYNVDQALQAAIDGCTWYAWLTGQLRNSGKPAKDLNRDKFTLDLSYKDSAFDGRVMWDVYSISILIGTESYRWPCAQFDVLADAGSPAALSVTTRSINPCVASEASLQIAKEWITNCLKNHPHCKLYMQGTLPNRVLDVTAGKDTVKLYEKVQNQHPSSARYIILSYCWGGDQPEKTTTSNISQHKAGILVTNLPQTIQDAIWVTQSLGVRYLWVDSLCIIQDNTQDVAKEIALMPEYYENSLITICASSSPTCEKGFLQRRPTIEYLAGPFNLQYQCPDGSTGPVRLVQHPSFSSKEEVINSRGWALQESLLSTRLLSYGTHNIRWSCLEAAWSDGGPWGTRYELDIRISWTDWRLKHLSSKLIEKDKITMPALMDHWKVIVESYTRRGLTDPHDKLSALSGVARRYHDILIRHNQSTTQYLAGLWPYEIIRQLLWVPAPQTTASNNTSTGSQSQPSKSTRFKEYLGPSWSWASLNGPINHPEWDYIPTLQDHRARVVENLGWSPDYSRAVIIDCKIEPTISAAPFSTIKSAILRLKGRTISVIPKSDWSEDEEFELMPDTEEDRMRMDQAILNNNTVDDENKLVLLQLARTGLLKGNIQFRPRGLILLVVEDYLHDYDDDHDDDDDGGEEEEGKEREVYYRRIGTFRMKSVPVSRDTDTYFDVVEPRIVTII